MVAAEELTMLVEMSDNLAALFHLFEAHVAGDDNTHGAPSPHMPDASNIAVMVEVEGAVDNTHREVGEH